MSLDERDSPLLPSFSDQRKSKGMRSRTWQHVSKNVLTQEVNGEEHSISLPNIASLLNRFNNNNFLISKSFVREESYANSFLSSFFSNEFETKLFSVRN